MDREMDPGFATPEEDSDDFARLLAESEQKATTELRAGAEVSGTIVQIGEQEVFVDCGARSELPLATKELQDDEGTVQHQVGDQITGHVINVDGELKLTLAIDLRKAGQRALENAYTNGTPVLGKVQDTNKGGFSVDLSGLRAFCPYSQIALHRVDDPSEFLDQSMEFKILELSEDNRNIVVSRRAILEQQRESVGAVTRASLAVGDELEGTVTRLMPFGAFVDIGGVEGLVHISQISHSRIDDPATVLQEGQTLRVKVIELQNLGEGKQERISLSLKALADDPWPAAATALAIGSHVPGVVTRLADFGAFVELAPGVDGLVHISEMADRRIIHPREICSEGDQVMVRVLNVDMDRHRISLSMRQADEPID